MFRGNLSDPFSSVRKSKATYWLRNCPEERSFHLLCCGILKSSIDKLSNIEFYNTLGGGGEVAVYAGRVRKLTERVGAIYGIILKTVKKFWLRPVTFVDIPFVMKTNLMHYLFSVCFVSQPLHVSGIFVAHHQKVYCIYTTIGTYCAFQLTVCWPAGRPTDSQLKNTTHTNCIYTVYLLMMSYKYARNM